MPWTADRQAVATESPRDTTSPPAREIRYEHSDDLGELLSSLRAALLVTTYQAGKLAVLGSHQNELQLSFHNFDRPMGVAITADQSHMAVAAKSKVWFLRNATDVANQLSDVTPRDACFLARTAQITGEIHAHEMAWLDNQLWIVNTLFSCLCTLDDRHSFVPRWQPKFISELAAEDRCHLNGIATANGKARFVTAMAESNSPGGWRATKAESGCVIDVDSRETVTTGFAMPHSPRLHQGHLWVLDSGRGALVQVDLQNGTTEIVARFPGYARGLAFLGEYAFVGLSKIRESSTFNGVPIAQDRQRLKCGVGVVHLETGKLAGQFEFKTGVDEIFDVTVLPDCPNPAMRGPYAAEDGAPQIWMVPPPTA